MKYLPWQSEMWSRLVEMRSRMPHALLIHGRAGIGKLHLVEVLAQSLLCEGNPQNQLLACGSCAACTWFAAGNHPDYRLVQPEILSAAEEESSPGEVEEDGKKKASRQIKIEQIRELSTFLNVGSHRKGNRVVLIHPAETMNPGSANALLKNLEEPTAGLVFILVSSQPRRLLPTIRSRCHVMAVPKPSREISVRWLAEQGSKVDAPMLAFAGDAPMDAASLDPEQIESKNRLFDLLDQPSASALGLADFCQRLPPIQVVEWMIKWTYDLITLSAGGQARYCVDREKKLAALVRGKSKRNLLKFYSYLISIKAIAEHPLNPRLFFDDLFFCYKQLS